MPVPSETITLHLSRCLCDHNIYQACDEIARYLMYQHHQINQPYGWIAQKAEEKVDSLESPKQLGQQRKHRRCRIFVDAYDTMRAALKRVLRAHHDSRAKPVKEVVLLFGSSVFTPKQVYSIPVKSCLQPTTDCQPLSGTQLSALCRQMMEGYDCDRSFAKTKLFILIGIAGQAQTYDGFVPQPRFKIDRNSKSYVEVSLRHDDCPFANDFCASKGDDFEVFHDASDNVEEITESLGACHLDSTENKTSQHTVYPTSSPSVAQKFTWSECQTFLDFGANAL